MKPRECDYCGEDRFHKVEADWREGLAAGWECNSCGEFHYDPDDPENQFEIGGDDYRGDADPGL